MKLAISGTYSSGKTLTSYALSHYVDIPRTRARTMRELLPFAVPGKTLEQCNGSELIQLIVRRHVERCVHESHLSKGFVSDGSSLQEWLYGSVRVIVGINPNDSVHLSDVETVERTPEMEFFAEVMDQLGKAIKEQAAIDELGIPRHVVGGTLPERLNRIVDIFGFAPVIDVDEAIERAQEEYRSVDMTIESDRALAVTAVS